jgi:glutaredoxin
VKTSPISRRLALLVLVAACGRRGEKKEESGELPSLSFRADQPGLLLTWIDAGGQTHLEESLAAIPEAHRELVRVVFEGEARGTGDPIYVADVRAPEADGGFTARSLARREWEAEIDRRRRDSREAARKERPRERPTAKPDAAPEAGSAAPQASGSADAKEAAPFGALTAIVYGAEWCGPCKRAKAHLKKRGVVIDYRDIDRDPSSRQEMLRKLGPRGRSDAPIPVIDLAGRVLVGFSAAAIDDAISAARRGSSVL